MTPQFAAGVCSLIGAIFFFGAGFFFARHKVAFDQGKLEKEIQAAKGREDLMREKAIQDNLSLKRNIDMQKQKNDAYQKATQKRITELKDQVVRLNSVVGDYKERLNDLAIEITRADSEKVLLTEALEVAKKDLKDISELEQENQELTNKLDSLRSRLKEFERIRKENRILTARILNMKPVKEQIETLETKETKTNALTKDSLQSSSSGASPTREGLREAFEDIVNQISQLDGSRGVVVADELGLLIAGIGDHMDNMAGMAAVFSEIDEKVSSLIPFGNVGSIKIKNLQDLNLIMQPFTMDSEKLILTILATGNGPDQDIVNQLTQQTITI
ncbi:MAG: hypothetical protein PVI90_11935 [Desulfobacteraceae bacterium]|jgi:hypothetical protein